MLLEQPIPTYVLVMLTDFNHTSSFVPFLGVGADLILKSHIWSPTISGGSCLVCSDQHSAARMCRLRNDSSRASRVSFQVECGHFLPGMMGMKSFAGLPNTYMAGENLVSFSGQYQYYRIAR